MMLLLIFWTHSCFGKEKPAGPYMNSNRINGQGVFVFYDGSKYVGQFKAGEPHGYGTITFPDGSRYVGEFLNGEMNGQGTMTFSDGSEYVGEFKDGALCGHGTITFHDGSVYEGQFDDDKYHGKGIWSSPFGIRYEGQFRDGKFHGQGIYSLPDGSRYIGYFKNDNFQGQGTWTVDGINNDKLDPEQSLSTLPEPVYEAKLPDALATPVAEVDDPNDLVADHANEIALSNGNRLTGEFPLNKEQVISSEDAEPRKGTTEGVDAVASYSIKTQNAQKLETTTEAAEVIISPRHDDRVSQGLNDNKASLSAFSELSFSVQVGAFLSRKNAEKLEALLKKRGYNAHLLPLNDFKKRAWFTVRIGSYATFAEAQEKATAFAEKENMMATVRPFDSL
jgi:hypothetical protein